MEDRKIDIAYIRVSTPQPKPGDPPRKGRVAQEDSLDRQEEHLRQWHEELGFPELLLVIADDCSGSRRDRPGFQKLVRLISQNKPKRLFYDSLSRLGRDQLTFHQFMWHCVKHGVETWDWSLRRRVNWLEHHDRLLYGFRALEAEHFLRQLRQDVSEGFRRARKTGRVAFGEPFGYRRDATRRLVIVVIEAAVVRRIFRETARGHGDTQIARRLELDRRAGRIPGPRRAPCWTAEQVLYIRKNPVYLGHTVIGWRSSRKTSDGGRIEPAVIRNTHRAIVSQSLHDRAQRGGPHWRPRRSAA